jgi:hypothetical protein
MRLDQRQRLLYLRLQDSLKSRLIAWAVGRVVDRHHGAGRLTAETPSERRPLPKRVEIAGVLRMEDAFVGFPGFESLGLP